MLQRRWTIDSRLYSLHVKYMLLIIIRLLHNIWVCENFKIFEGHAYAYITSILYIRYTCAKTHYKINLNKSQCYNNYRIINI